MAELIKVKSGLADRSRIALYEQHPDHPRGEVLVKGEGEFEVARTRAVLMALGEGRLVEVAEAEPPAAASEPPDLGNSEEATKGRKGRG
jgi:hypothetical protein